MAWSKRSSTSRSSVGLTPDTRPADVHRRSEYRGLAPVTGEEPRRRAQINRCHIPLIEGSVTSPDPPPGVFDTQPAAEASPRVAVHGAAGRAHRTQPEVVRPPLH